MMSSMLRKKTRLNNDSGIEHYGFKVESTVALLDLENSLLGNMEQRFAAIENAKALETFVPQNDPVLVSGYNPSDPKMLESFDTPEVNIQTIQDIVKKKEASVAKQNNPDDLVFFNVKEEEQAAPVVAAAPTISDRVTAAIQRELKDPRMASANTPKVNINSMVTGLLAGRTAKPKPSVDPIASALRRARKKNQRSKLSLIALESDIGESISGSLQNFGFIPSFDDGQSIEDFNEGEVEIDYSLFNESGIIRGALVKNSFVRTTIEAPLGEVVFKDRNPND